jgi:hypothetical protein
MLPLPTASVGAAVLTAGATRTPQVKAWLSKHGRCKLHFAPTGAFYKPANASR